MPKPQTYANHTRYDPPFHFVIVPLLLVNLGFAIYATIHAWPGFRHTHLWWIVMAVVFLLMAGTARGEALRAQDRIIRLEERLRMAVLLPAAELPLVESLTLRQLIALRFASDVELPALALRAVAEGLTPKQIKQSIVNWRPDECRV
jgi:hypothetical protein